MEKIPPYFSQKKNANRLINESSTYLLQHAYNPVNWFPWSQEALTEAIATDKPIMLSIGYSACHWCHVMEEESFQDEETAKIINEYFIPIKVDREERPDIDDIYMTAVQLMTGHGGWPLTVFLTPQQKPFYGGTYFPKEDRYHGQHILPGFKTILNAINQAWQSQRDQAQASADRMTEAITSISRQITKQSQITEQTNNSDLLIACASKLLLLFDSKWGGFAGAPKFPQTMALQLCLQAAFKSQQRNENEKAKLFFNAVSSSLDGMANGGIYDHLGGGFARYSTDEKWLIPHFEKMLYDNALLVPLYLDAFSIVGKTSWLQIATQTLDFISRELTSEQGGFYSALDADSEGVEGKFYIWQKKEIDEILGQDSQFFCESFGVTESGNFEHKNNILFLKNENESSKKQQKINALKQKLLIYRSKRTRPTRDDKILTSWNGLTISAYVHGYRVSGENKYLSQAQKAAQFILNNSLENARLKHSYARDKATLDAYLDDYAFFSQALIDLASVDSNPIWLEKALLLTDSMLKHFFSSEECDLFYTANDHEKLITRPKNFYDGPLPSATSIAIANLLKMEILTNDQSYKQVALKILNKHQNFFNKHPNQYASLITAWELVDNPPLCIVLVISKQAAKDKQMLSAIFNAYSSNKIVVLKDSQIEKSYSEHLTILSQKDLLNNQPTIYICKKQSCQAPINDIDKAKITLNNS